MNKCITIKVVLSDKLKNYKSTFKMTSFDNSKNEYLCQDNETRVYNFDKYVSENYDLSQLPASPDAIYLGDKKCYFVEFKNSPISNIKNINIKNKFISGTKILQELLDDCIQDDVKFIFCVVHKADTKSPYFDSSDTEANITKFNLDAMNDELGMFYSKIITRDIDFYKQEFNDDLRC